MLIHRTPLCTANLLFILDLYYLPFAGLVFVCVDSEVVYSMFEFFAVVLLLSSLLFVLLFSFSTSDHCSFISSSLCAITCFWRKIYNKRRSKQKSYYCLKLKRLIPNRFRCFW